MVVVQDYPVQLGLAYLFLGGYTIRSVFVAVGLPPSVGVILTGFLFTYFAQEEIFEGRDELQELAFFLVLLIAGLEISLSDLKFHIFVVSWLPVTMEITGIAIFSTYHMSYTIVEGLVLGTVLCALGDGLVIPKMKEFGLRFPTHPLPKLVFTHAPLEASFALTAFGIFAGFASPAHTPPANIGLILASNILRIVATLLCGAVLGATTGYFLPQREQLTLRGSPIFNGTLVEAFLVVLAVTLIAFALGKGNVGEELVPMGFVPGSMFQPELSVIVTGTFFGHFTDKHLLHEIEATMGGLWVFGQLILFSMLGSKTSPRILPRLDHVLPVMGVGLACRFVGVFFAVFSTARARKSPLDYKTLISDAIFCFLCVIPRATIQGALGAVPLKQHFFSHSRGYVNTEEVQHFTFTAARLYIVCTSIVGMLFLNTFGPRLLARTLEAHEEMTKDKMSSTTDTQSTELYQRIEAAVVDNEGVEEQWAMDLVAQKHGITPTKLVELLGSSVDSAPGPQAVEGTQTAPSLAGHRVAAAYDSEMPTRLNPASNANVKGKKKPVRWERSFSLAMFDAIPSQKQGPTSG